MESFYAVLANLGPWLGGAIGGVLILVLTNRRSLLTYNVTHQRIGMSADDAVHGKVEVFFRGNLVDRLYLSVMQIRNRGIRDLENLNLKTYRGHDAMAMLTEEARLDGSARIGVVISRQHGDAFFAA